MKCCKCGYEIQEGNTFCTNCGEKIDVNNTIENIIQDDKNSNKVNGKIKIRVWHIIVLIILIITIIIIAVLLKQKEQINNQLEAENTYQQELYNNAEQVLEEVQESDKEQEKGKLEIGKKYICSTADADGYVIFNKNNTLEIKLGDTETEYYILKGTYKVNKDTIDAHINYNSAYLIISVDEDEEEKLDPSFKEYDTVIKILKDGELEYTNEYDTKYIFELNNLGKKIEDENEKKELKKRDLIELDNKVFNFTEKEFIDYLEKNTSYGYIDSNYTKSITEKTIFDTDLITYTNKSSNGEKCVSLHIDRTTNKIIDFWLTYTSEKDLSSSEREKEENIQFEKAIEVLYFLANGVDFHNLSEEEKIEFNKNFKKPIQDNEYNYYLQYEIVNEEFSSDRIEIPRSNLKNTVLTIFSALEAPNLKGRKLEKAIEICKSLGLEYEIEYIETSEPIQKGVVFNQSNITVVYGGVKGRKKNQVESIKIILTKEYEER